MCEAEDAAGAPEPTGRHPCDAEVCKYGLMISHDLMLWFGQIDIKKYLQGLLAAIRAAGAVMQSGVLGSSIVLFIYLSLFFFCCVLMLAETMHLGEEP